MQHSFKSAASAVYFLLLLLFLNLKAQDTTATYIAPNETFSKPHADKTYSKSHIFIGTQIPLQCTAGYKYRFSNRLSARAQAGFITKPYSGFIVDAMEAFGMNKQLSRVIKKAFKSGTVIGIGPNYHFDRKYDVVYEQDMT